MNKTLLPDRSYWLRWLALIVATVIVVFILRTRVASAAEVFWCLFPLWLMTAALGLQLFRFPRMTTRSRTGRLATYAVLTFFPVLYYGFLVQVTETAWSWKELFLCLYFFGLSLECLLLVFFGAATTIEKVIRNRFPGHGKWPVLLMHKLVIYAILVPFLLVVFAVHRPKMMPRQIIHLPGETVEEVRFPARDGLLIRGRFLTRTAPLGTVIVCHGVGANHADIQEFFLPLYRAGFQILAFDFRGHGLSAGHTVTYGLQERLDVLGAYDYCLSRSDVDSQRLFALGFSMGGSALLQALPEMPAVRAAVVDSAFASLEEMIAYQMRVFPKIVRDPLVQLARGFAWIETGADVCQHAPVERLGATSIPLMIIHGSEDEVVPVAQAKALHAAATGPVQLHIHRGAPHIGAMFMDEFRYRRRVEAHFLSAVE